MSKKILSLADLDITKKCEEGYEFEVTDDSTGKGTGLFLTVIGAHAPVLTNYVQKSLNQRRAQEAMNEKRGNKARVRPIEDDIEFGTELSAKRVIAWRGISDECTHENDMTLCRTNPLIKEQILKASEDLANFTKSSAKS